MAEDWVIGIDLGTTHSLVAVVDSGFPVIIPGPDGERLLPSVVTFAPEGPVVGWKARRQRLIQPGRTLASTKRWMGRKWDAAGKEEALDRVVPNEAGWACYRVDGRERLPEEVAAEILRELKAWAQAYWGHEVRRAVVTVPAYFNDAQRQATRRAAEAAGLTVERILNEPTAAALAYGMDRRPEDSLVAVYDLGGGTFDLSILECREGMVEVKSTCGDTRLGGDDVDRCVVATLLERMAQVGIRGIHPEGLARVEEAAEAAKRRLSEVESAEINLPFIDGERSFSTVLTRDELETLARPIVERTRSLCLRALRDAGVEAGQIDRVLLVGGQTRMPLVRRLVREIFGREAECSINPDEVVALGAAVQGGILSGVIQDMVLLDVTPLSLGIETFGGLMNVLIPRNSTIPTKAGEMFTNPMDGQREMKIHVLQGERELARDNWSLGEFTLSFEPAPRGQARVGVQFEIDANGILKVLARDTKTGAEKVLELKSVVDVSDEAVEKMVSESVEYALEDMRERQWVESVQAAERQLAAVNRALELVGDELGPAVRERAWAGVQAVRTAMDSHDGPLLKKKLRDLDQATAELAQHLMQRSLDRALQSKGSGGTGAE